MEHYYTYILHSKTLDKFYIGATRLHPEIRKQRHLLEYYGNSKYTSKSADWELFLEIACESFTQALKIENHIKRMKSRKYILNLAKYPELVENYS